MAIVDDPVPLIDDDEELKLYGVVRVKLDYSILDCKEWAMELSRVTPENMTFEGDGEFAYYRSILDESASDYPFLNPDLFLQSQAEMGKVLQKHFLGLASSSTLSEILRMDDAFCIHYDSSTQQDTSGAKHVDPSDITINLCLDKSDGIQDSHVIFFGTQPLIEVDCIQSSMQKFPHTLQLPSTSYQQNNGCKESSLSMHQNDVKFAVEQRPGFATLHWGRHPHETMAVRGKGTRTNIVLTFCYKNAFKNDK
jgi:hypothetical protein